MSKDLLLLMFKQDMALRYLAQPSKGFWSYHGFNLVLLKPKQVLISYTQSVSTSVRHECEVNFEADGIVVVLSMEGETMWPINCGCT